jgi:hypothetical protein
MLKAQPQSELDQVGQALVALALEVMLRRPQHVVAEALHELRHVARGRKDLPQALGGIAAVVGRRAGTADIVELDLADIEHMEVSDHRAISPASNDRHCEDGIAPRKLECTSAAT